MLAATRDSAFAAAGGSAIILIGSAFPIDARGTPTGAGRLGLQATAPCAQSPAGNYCRPRRNERVLPGTNARYRREQNQTDERKSPRSRNREPAR